MSQPGQIGEVPPPVKKETRKSRIRAFWDFLILFSGISTASNLSRTQGRPVKTRGVFLFRSRSGK